MHRMSQCQHLHHMDHASITTSTMDCDLQVTITMYQNIKHNNDTEGNSSSFVASTTLWDNHLLSN